MLIHAMCAISFTRGKSIDKYLNIEQFRLQGNLEAIIIYVGYISVNKHFEYYF